MTETEPKKILLQNLLHLTDEEGSRAKVRFIIEKDCENPIELFKVNPDIPNTKWLFWNERRKYFRVGQIAICLVRIKDDLWLLTTVKEVTKDLDVHGGTSFEGEELERTSEFFGRTIVRYHKRHQVQDRMYDAIADELEVVQVLPDVFDDDHFPGYDNVSVGYLKLKRILESGKTDWKSALENQKGVYVITDTRTGKLYIGSATAERGMFLKRWGDYVRDGHGGDVELKALVKKVGLAYVKDNFQYSIIENFNARVDDARILQREAYWKRVLCSREFGYNGN